MESIMFYLQPIYSYAKPQQKKMECTLCMRTGHMFSNCPNKKGFECVTTFILLCLIDFKITFGMCAAYLSQSDTLCFMFWWSLNNDYLMKYIDVLCLF